MCIYYCIIILLSLLYRLYWNQLGDEGVAEMAESLKYAQHLEQVRSVTLCASQSTIIL